MPNRILRDGINSSDRINALSVGAELLYRRLMSVCDDYGRFHAAPVTIRGACWPTCPDRFSDAEIVSWMNELLAGERPLIRVYQSNVLQRKCPMYLELMDFGQQIRSKSKYPEPAIILLADCYQNDTELRTGAITTATAPAPASPHTTTPPNLTRAHEADEIPNARESVEFARAGGIELPKPRPHEKCGVSPSQRFEEFWKRYPRQIGRERALHAWCFVATVENEPAIFACLESYAASDEVSRGVLMAGDKWLNEQAADGWASRWPPRIAAVSDEDVKSARAILAAPARWDRKDIKWARERINGRAS